MPAALQKVSHRASIQTDILEMLIRNEIVPGQHISEETLAATKGVSRTPVREALILLERQKLVVNEPNRGFFAATASLAGLRNYFDMASWLFPFLVQRAVRNLRGEVTQPAATLLNASADEPSGDLLVKHFQFVGSIALAAQNPFAADTMIAGEAFHCMTRASILSDCAPEVSHASNVQIIEQGHRLIELIKSGDADKAVEGVLTAMTQARTFLASQSI
ncbi:MAG: GntR family transcriptional regulator [Pseudomonadota bacterium]